jgi:hypothetical protein
MVNYYLLNMLLFYSVGNIYENFTYLNAFINDDGNDLICAADV